VLALVATAVAVTAAGSGDGTAATRLITLPVQADRDPATILVKFSDPSNATAVIAAHGDRHLGTTATKVDIVKVAAGANLDATISSYAARRDVVFAEPNYIAHASLAAPNDPSYGADWGMDKTRAVEGWTAYPGSYTGTGGVPLAVVDTGVQSSHPDLAGRVQTALGANCVNPSATCGSSAALDDNGHGTHVAGIAGAATNNALGVAGIAYSSPIIPVKVLDSGGSGSYGSITNGIIWAVQKGAKVVNLSLGGTGFSQTLCDAVTSALNSGTLIVAAAGNSGNSVPSYPAACPGVVGVAATDSTDGIPSFSNYGSPNVFVSAPGASIYSTYFNSSYATLSGTSMAAPFVTGLSAVLLSQVTTRTPTAVKNILATTSDKLGSGAYGSDPYGTCGGCTWNASYGYGRINAARALALAGPPAPGSSITSSVAAAGDDGNVMVTGPAYPPVGGGVPNTTGTVLTAGRRFVYGGYDVFAGLVRFDTSAIPDDATVTAATLRLYVTGKADRDNRNLVGEWYGAGSWPIDAADYVLNPVGSALVGADLGAIVVGASNEFALTGLGSISKTGFTGLRLGVDGGQPTADNFVQIAAFDHATLPEPRLVVTYTP
jgi:thermitase